MSALQTNRQQSYFFSIISASLYSLLVLLFATACSCQDNRYLQKSVVEVNGTALTAEEFSQRLARELKIHDAITAKESKTVERIKENIIKSFIFEAILQSWALENNLSVDEQELEKEISKIRSDYPDDISFIQALSEEGISLEEWKTGMYRHLLQKKVAGALTEKLPPFPEQELKAYYKENKKLFSHDDRVRLLHLVVEKEENAEVILKELKRGRKKFEDMAKKFSILPDADQGGDTGWIEKGTFSVFDKAFDMRVGSLSPILKSDFGYHIFRVIKKQRAETLSFKEAKTRIERMLKAQREDHVFREWLQNQVRKAQVMRDDELLKAIVVETRGA